MSRKLALLGNREVISAKLEEATHAARDYIKASKAAATRRAYDVDARQFRVWCESHGLSALPASVPTAAAYFAALAKSGRYKASSIGRKVASIRFLHASHGYDSPTTSETVKAVLTGIRRTQGTAVTRKAPADNIVLTSMVSNLTGVRGARDRALLLLGFAGALRRSELVALDVGDLEFVSGGLLIHLRRSKTDQDGHGTIIAVPNGQRMDVISTIKRWLTLSKIESGPLFRSISRGNAIQSKRLTATSVALIVKRHAHAAGLDPAKFSGHSLRSGFVTSALKYKADVFRTMDQSRHKSIETLRIYDRRVKAFNNHSGEDFL